MSTHRTVIKHKVGLLRLAQELGNVSQACRVMGYSRDTFYRYQQAVEEGGVEALLEKSRRKPILRNRTAPEIEEAIVGLAFEQPAFGQVRVSNELRKRGHHISPAGVRGVWLRHGLQTFKHRLAALERKVAEEGVVLTEAQVAALEQKRDDEQARGEIETVHPGYLGGQDTFHVGTLKGVGRIYQQTFIDTYTKWAAAKLYTAKTAGSRGSPASTALVARVRSERQVVVVEDEGQVGPCRERLPHGHVGLAHLRLAVVPPAAGPEAADATHEPGAAVVAAIDPELLPPVAVAAPLQVGPYRQPPGRIDLGDQVDHAAGGVAVADRDVDVGRAKNDNETCFADPMRSTHNLHANVIQCCAASSIAVASRLAAHGDHPGGATSSVSRRGGPLTRRGATHRPWSTP